jgi:CHRD domain
MNSRSLAAASLAALIAISTTAAAEVIALKADLSAQAEVPSNPSQARGTAEMSLDTASRNLAWTIQFVGLSAPLSAAHFHGPAMTSANAGILVPITASGGESPLTGFATLTQPQVEEIVSGSWYINLHTRTYPGGEIRGQVTRK